MGVLGKRGEKKTPETVEWTEQKILDILNQHYFNPNSVKYLMNNLYVFHNTWESDYLAMTKSGYWYEGEVKISRSDFKADKKKKRKHLILENASNEKDKKPHYFFYAVPKGLIEVDEVPDYAGLVYILDRYPYIQVMKNPCKLHGDKYTVEQLNLTDKFYYSWDNLRNKVNNTYKRELASARKIINEAKVDENGNKYTFTLGEYDALYKKYLKENVELSNRIRQLETDAKWFVSQHRQDTNRIKELEEQLGESEK